MPSTTLKLSVLALTILTGCAQYSSDVEYEVPEDLRTCFDTLTPAPTQQTMSASDMFKLVAELRKSEVEKSICGKRLLSWVDTVLG